MKTRKFVILFILVTVLATIVISCQVRIRETETYLKSRDGTTKDLPVIGSKTKSGGMSKIKIVPTALPGVVTLSIPNALPSSTQSIEETFTDTDDPITLKQIRWTLEPAFPNLKFENLTNLIQIDDAIGGFIVTEQEGLIYYFSNDQDVKGATVLLDLSDRVSTRHNEEGLLGIALSPNFTVDRSLYIFYSANKPRRSVLSRFVLDDNSISVVDSAKEIVIFDVPQPYGNHNGGLITFGPDGFLYISLGDGGGAGDPEGHAQNIGTLLGSILRIDVTADLDGQRYKIPGDNPFVNLPNVRPEIWAYGLRNPWRFSFDNDTGSLFVGDVGQEKIEEINIVRKGQNYGWPVMEGTLCYSPSIKCNASGMIPPIIEHGHDQECSIIGGYVYRGVGLPGLHGRYIYGDYCSGKIWEVNVEELIRGDSTPRLLVDSDLYITSFAQDLSGNLYVLSQNTGIYRLVTTN